jgi:hypothetical protein
MKMKDHELVFWLISRRRDLTAIIDENDFIVNAEKSQKSAQLAYCKNYPCPDFRDTTEKLNNIFGEKIRVAIYCALDEIDKKLKQLGVELP